MRADMAKVITERPRAGGGRVESKAYRDDVHWGRLREQGREDESPSREAIAGLKWGSTRKHFTDFLSPVVGFLRKHVGRPWDDVWSELCRVLDGGSTTQRHVLEHVRRDFVVLHTRAGDDGEVRRSTGEPLVSRWGLRRHGLFYVCPFTRELRHLPPRKRPRNRFWSVPHVDVTEPIHRIDGVWFAVEFARIPQGGAAWDTMFRREVRDRGSTAQAHWKDGGALYCAKKRQLHRRELRRLGLRGAPS
jgi:hypothetical protein